MVSFVYFDLGGTVIRDFSGTNYWEELKRELGVTPEKDQDFDNFWNKYEPEVCIGRDVETLKPLLNQQLGLKISDDFSILNAFVRRFEKNETIWPILDFAKEHFEIGLLTNMYPEMLAAIKQKNILPPISWDIIIDSSVAKIQKPDPAIFQLAEEKSGAKHKEILFIENGIGNVEAAKNFGWQTFWYDSADVAQSSRALKEYLRELV